MSAPVLDLAQLEFLEPHRKFVLMPRVTWEALIARVRQLEALLREARPVIWIHGGDCSELVQRIDAALRGTP